MTARARSLLAPVLLLPVALSSCGGGGPSAPEYVRAVCTATTDWQRDIEQQGAELAQSLDPQAGPAEQKMALAGLLDQLIAATDRYIGRVDAIGAPDVEGGEDAAQGLNTALRQIEEAFRSAREETDQLPTSSPEAFQQAADRIGERVNSSVSGIDDPFEGEAALIAAADKEPACQTLQG